MPVKSDRLTNLPPYVFAVIGDRIRKMQQSGIDVIRLDVGSPDLPPPDHVVTALYEAAQRPGNHGYSGYRGIAEFREAVARYYQRRFAVTVDPDKQVLPLIGSKEGIVNLSLAYLAPGDVALVPELGYPSYEMGARLAQAEVAYVPMNEDTCFLPDLDAVSSDVLSRAKLLWLNYPNNPTGVGADTNFYQQATEFCRRHDLLMVSDNPYVDVTYDGYVAGSALQVEGSLSQSLEFMSMSKGYNMAGWRLGAAVGSAEAIETLLQVKSNVDSGHFKAVYHAGIAAIDNTPEAWIHDRNMIYQSRRDIILEALSEIGLEAAVPKGALYVWARVLEGTGSDYVEKALKDAHVSIAPGAAYGPSGNDYVRISVAVSEERIRVALERLKLWRDNQ